MHRVSFLFVITLFMLCSSVFGQRVLRRNGVVSLGSKPCLTYEITKVPGVWIYAYRALGEEEVLFEAHSCTNWTTSGGDEYRHYYFPGENLELILPSKRKYRFQLLFPKMVEADVLGDDWELNGEALRRFVARYHVPLPRRFGPRVHQFPVIGNEKSSTHQWEFSKDYDPDNQQWK